MQTCPVAQGRCCSLHRSAFLGTHLNGLVRSQTPASQRPFAANPVLQPFRLTINAEGGASAPSRGRGGSSRGGRGGGRGGGGRGGSTMSRPPSRGGFQGGPSRGGGVYRGGGPSRGRGGMQRNQPDPRVISNQMIQSDEVRLLNEDKEMLGVFGLEDAIQQAEDVGLDVVLISPDADPPVCRMMDASRHKYELDKKDKEAKKKQREARQDVKELKVRPGTDVHDYEVRLRAAVKFLKKGDKVKFTLQFRGREMQFQDEGSKMFERFMADLKDEALIESQPAMSGRTMSMTLAPAKP